MRVHTIQPERTVFDGLRHVFIVKLHHHWIFIQHRCSSNLEPSISAYHRVNQLCRGWMCTKYHIYEGFSAFTMKTPAFQSSHYIVLLKIIIWSFFVAAARDGEHRQPQFYSEEEIPIQFFSLLIRRFCSGNFWVFRVFPRNAVVDSAKMKSWMSHSSMAQLPGEGHLTLLSAFAPIELNSPRQQQRTCIKLLIYFSLFCSAIGYLRF